MNKKLRKILTLACSAVLLVCLSVGATVAYLTSATDVVTNTFSIGNVKIKLDEVIAEYDEEKHAYVGTKDRTEATDSAKEQSYKLLPGVKIDKDPTVTVVKESENCYVRAWVTVSYDATAEALLTEAMADGWVKELSDLWVPNGAPTTTKVTEDEKTTVTRVYELRYANEVTAEETKSADKVLAPIFTGIEIPGDLTNDELATLADLSIAVKAEAIQADGFADAAAAWAAWKN